LRDIESAAAIRYHIYEMLDSATWPESVQHHTFKSLSEADTQLVYSLSETTRQALLTWVIVGGGPTGSELAAEMHDLARSKEFNKLYPTLAPQIKIKLLDAAPAILTNFDKALSKYAAKKLKRDVSCLGCCLSEMPSDFTTDPFNRESRY
jgi:NADH dehydrogenase FAD-containing subunit